MHGVLESGGQSRELTEDSELWRPQKGPTLVALGGGGRGLYEMHWAEEAELQGEPQAHPHLARSSPWAPRSRPRSAEWARTAAPCQHPLLPHRTPSLSASFPIHPATDASPPHPQLLELLQGPPPAPQPQPCSLAMVKEAQNREASKDTKRPFPTGHISLRYPPPTPSGSVLPPGPPAEPPRTGWTAPGPTEMCRFWTWDTEATSTSHGGHGVVTEMWRLSMSLGEATEGHGVAGSEGEQETEPSVERKRDRTQRCQAGVGPAGPGENVASLRKVLLPEPPRGPDRPEEQGLQLHGSPGTQTRSRHGQLGFGVSDPKPQDVAGLCSRAEKPGPDACDTESPPSPTMPLRCLYPKDTNSGVHTDPRTHVHNSGHTRRPPAGTRAERLRPVEEALTRP